MPDETLQSYRLKAHWSLNQLAEAANVDRRTVKSAEEGNAVYDYIAQKIVDALNKKLSLTLTIETLKMKTL